MSIEKCSHCDRFIDTDFDAEVYREEFDGAVVCDPCMDKFDAETAEESTLGYFNRYIAGDR